MLVALREMEAGGRWRAAALLVAAGLLLSAGGTHSSLRLGADGDGAVRPTGRGRRKLAAPHPHGARRRGSQRRRPVVHECDRPARRPREHPHRHGVQATVRRRRGRSSGSLSLAAVYAVFAPRRWLALPGRDLRRGDGPDAARVRRELDLGALLLPALPDAAGHRRARLCPAGVAAPTAGSPCRRLRCSSSPGSVSDGPSSPAVPRIISSIAGSGSSSGGCRPSAASCIWRSPANASSCCRPTWAHRGRRSQWTCADPGPSKRRSLPRHASTTCTARCAPRPKADRTAKRSSAGSPSSRSRERRSPPHESSRRSRTTATPSRLMIARVERVLRSDGR